MFSFSTFTHNYTKSYFKFTEPLSKDYTVLVNGVPAPVYTCRISAYPLNRVWTGFQRPVNQSELASFVNIVSDEPVTLTVTTTLPHEKILLKPYSKGIVPVEEDGKITFTIPAEGQFVLEADSYHHCLYIFNSKPIPCPDPASVTHYFGPGIHMPGKIRLSSGDSVYVDKDALVYGCLFAEDAENIHIFGNGLFDDSSEERIDIGCYEDYTNGNLKFYDCKNVRIEGILCRNSAIWCLNLFHCFDVVADGIKIFGQWRYNTDGADIVNCQNITIKNSFIHSFDDTITIKGIDRYAHTNNENILAENCVLWCDWGKTCEVGIETACREYKNITFRNCDLLRAGNTALDIMNGDCAEVSGITFEDIRVEIDAFNTCSKYQATDETVYDLQNTIEIPALVRFSNPVWRSRSNFELWGVPEHLLCDLKLDDIRQGSIHDVVCRNLTVYYGDGVPMTDDGRYNVLVQVNSVREGVRFENILVENVVVNGERITKDTAVEYIREVDGYAFK